MIAKLEMDIFTCNTMLRSMVRDLGLPHSKDEPTIHVQYKNYGLSDYLVTSTKRTAGGIRRSAAVSLCIDRFGQYQSRSYAKVLKFPFFEEGCIL